MNTLIHVRCSMMRATRRTSGNAWTVAFGMRGRFLKKAIVLRFRIAVLAICILLTACDEARPKPEVAEATDQAAPAATVKPCEPPGFTPIGTPLSFAATDTKTGQQCRAAENGSSFFASLPMCRDLTEKEKLAPSCGQRFTPLGTPPARVALDSQTGQQCRTADNAPSFFVSLPMCRDLQ